MRIPLPLLLTVLAAPAAAQNLYQQNHAAAAVIADLRARDVGDVLTVTINEQHSVTNDEKVERTNNTSLAARLEAWTLTNKTFNANVLPKIDVRKDQSFTGESKQDHDSTVKASVAVIVIDVQPNGNLVVAGTRTVQVDDETKTLRISGIVRPLDVSQANTISSSLVADARVAIVGNGASTRQVTRGPVGTLVDTLLWAAWPF
jgi:flagellar L-ring protein precursor FlgH